MATIFNGPIDYTGYPPYGIIKPGTPTPGTPPMPIKFSRNFNDNGKVMVPIAETNLHMVADDLATGTDNWVSRIGGYIAYETGLATTPGLATPYYPAGFAGATNRKAVSGFGFPLIIAADYRFNWDASFELGAATTLSYLVAVKSGGGFSNETILSLNDGVGYNFLLYFSYDFVTGYSIRTLANFSVTGCDIYENIEPYAHMLIGVTFDGPSKTLILHTPSGATSATGVGTNYNTTGSQISIGANLSNFDSMLKGNITEIMKFNKVISRTEYEQYLYRFYGAQADTGQYPTGYIRNSGSGFVNINDQIYGIGANIPRVCDIGLPIEEAMQNGLLDTDFTESPSLWTATILGMSIVTIDTTDTDANKDISGNAALFTNDAGVALAVLEQTTVDVYNANAKIFFMVSWRAKAVGARLNYSIQNTATANYWNNDTQTWVPTIYENKFTSTDTLKHDDFIIFPNDVTSGTINVAIGNGGDIANSLKDFAVYHVQTIEKDRYCTHQVNFGDIVGQNDESPLLFASTGNIDYALGSMAINVKYFDSSLAPLTDNVFLFAADGDMFTKPASTNNQTMSDGTNTTILTNSYTYLDSFTYSLQWTGLLAMQITNLNTGSVNSSAMLSVIDAGTNFAIGGKADGTEIANCAIKSVTIR